MSVKRQATTELNHENWDQDDPSEHEEMGSFKTASKDILEKRVIRTAKRRSQASGDEAKKGVFSGFGGFNKPPPSSFDFLANLTNGNKTTNGSPAAKSDTEVTSNLFGSKTSSGTGGNFFNTATLASSTTKPTFGTTTSQTLFAISSSSANTATTQSLFTASKADSTVADTSCKIQAISSSSDSSNTNAASKSTNVNSNAFTSQVTSSMFGVNNANNSKSVFSATPFKAQTESNSSTNFGITANTASGKNNEEKSNDNKLRYHAKLKGLNESVSDWIKKQVEETPLCILTPIFKDYEKYLKEIQDEYESGKDDNVQKVVENTDKEPKANSQEVTKSVPTFSNISTGSSLFGQANTKPSIFAVQNNPSVGEKTSGFAFGTSTSSALSSSSSVASTAGGFSFGINTSTNTANSSVAAPFSFGTGKPFSFSSNVQNNVEKVNETNEEEDEPPKVEFTPVVEENSVFDKKCKIFVKKDGNFVDKGVGTLYIKKIEESGKHQLLVRANTNLGNVLLNLILASSIPTQRLGKNNVMMVCIPTPEAKPPPTPILIRVKTSEEADELLETLNKYKV